MARSTVEQLIERFGLQPLPVEGTLYASTHAAEAGTAMIGLYSAEPLSRSYFHRLTHDEVWHHYDGDPLRLVLLHPDGTSEERILGTASDGLLPQTVIPAGTWQAGELVDGGDWALFGCTVAPGFTPACFEAATVGPLLAAYPEWANDIVRLALPDGATTEMPGTLPS